MLSQVSPFRNLRFIEYLLLAAAYRSLSRLSSAPSAKAFALRPCSLDLSNVLLRTFGILLILSCQRRLLLPFLLKLQYFLKRTYYNLCFAVIIQFSRYVFECPFQGPQNRTISTLLVCYLSKDCPSFDVLSLPDSLERR